MKLRILGILAFFSASALFADPVGWGNVSLVDTKIEEYGVCCHEGEPRLYAVTTRLKTPFQEEQATTLELQLHFTEAGHFQKRVLAEIILAPSEKLFPIYPSVSALGNEILVAWQETQPSGGASGIYFVYSNSGPDGFSQKQVLPNTAGKLNAILPLAKIAAPGRQIIFYQEPSSLNRFNLTAVYGAHGIFNAASHVATLSASTRGALFPSTLRRGKRLDLVYQNRAEATFIDDIFRTYSEDGGASWRGGTRLTNNGFQNFSGQITNSHDKLYFIWQSNPNKVWSVFYSAEGEEQIQVNDNASPSYLPTIVASNDTIVAAWQDTRSGAAQVFGKFLSRPDNPIVGVDHRVSKEGVSQKPMEFVRWGQKPFLFYGCGRALCMREADTSAEAVQIYSRTHALGKVSKSSDAIFNWKKINDISGIESYAWVIDDQKNTDPDFYNLNPRAIQITVPGLNGGAYFLHMKYRDLAGNISPTTHYPFVVDSIPPSKPIIKSTTHENGIPDSKRDVTLSFVSSDDSGIQVYRYAFASILPRTFTEETTSSEITFRDVPDGDYVFAVEAVDLGGNVSPRAFYSVQIGANERNDLTIKHNAEADVISRPDITFTIQDHSRKGIKEVFYQSGFDLKDPFKGQKAFLETAENLYNARIDKLETGISVISLGIVYKDGTRAAPRHFYFDSNDPRARKKFEFTDVEYEALPVFRERPPFEVGGRANLISSKFEKGILEIRLHYDAKNLCENPAVKNCKPKLIKTKGFIYEIASSERIPQGEMNFAGPVEFIYLQKPGVYFLNAKALFKGPERKQFAYDALRVDVPDLRKDFRKHIYLSIGGILALLTLVAFWQRRRIIFYMGALS